MADITAFEAYYHGQDAGVQTVSTLYNGANPAQWDRLIGIMLGTVADTGAMITAARTEAGIDSLYAIEFGRGWHSGFWMAFAIRCARPAFAARYQELAAQKEDAELAAMRQQAERDAALAAETQAAIHGEAPDFNQWLWQDGEAETSNPATITDAERAYIEGGN